MKLLPLFLFFLTTSVMAEKKHLKPCVFCDIVAGKAPAHKVWESKTHLAFLSNSGRVKGGTIVIPKKHTHSYAFKLSDKALCDFMTATKKVALLLDKKIQGVARTKLILEGLEVSHLHARLYPLYYGGAAFKTGTKTCSPTLNSEALSTCLRDK